MPSPRIEGHVSVEVYNKNDELVQSSDFQNSLTDWGRRNGLGSGSGPRTIPPLNGTTGYVYVSSLMVDSSIINHSQITGTKQYVNELLPQVTTIWYDATTLGAAYTQSDVSPELDYIEYHYKLVVPFQSTMNGYDIKSIYISGSYEGSQVFASTNIKDELGNPMTIQKEEDVQIFIDYRVRFYRGADTVQPFSFNGVNYNLLYSTLRREGLGKNWLTDPSSIVGRGIPMVPNNYYSTTRTGDGMLIYRSTYNSGPRSMFALSTIYKNELNPSMIDEMFLDAIPENSRNLVGFPIYTLMGTTSGGYFSDISQFRPHYDPTYSEAALGTSQHYDNCIYILDEDGFPTSLELPADFGLKIKMGANRVEGAPVTGWPHPLPIGAGSLTSSVTSTNSEPNSIEFSYIFGTDGKFATRQVRTINNEVTHDQTANRGFMLPSGATVSNYEARVVQNSGPSSTLNELSSWTTLGTLKTVSHTLAQATVGTTTEILNFTLEVREISNPSNIVSANGTMTMTATVS